METLSDQRCFGGRQLVCRHRAQSTACDMTFSVFLPPQPGPRPALMWLSGLTCTQANATEKAGFQRVAAELGLIVICPDTSPRGDDVADDDAYDLGKGAGFYVNATQDPWAKHFKMWDYVVDELPALVAGEFPLDMERQSITGHSMGGHGALTIAMNTPGRFKSVSAFSPICNPMGSDWGRKQLTAYLGGTETAWAKHDASHLMREKGFDGPVLMDTGSTDQFIDLLRPEIMADAIASRRQPAVFRLQKGYDHSYFFVSSFMEEHVAFHAEALFG